MNRLIDLRRIPAHEPSLWLRNEIQAIGQQWAGGRGSNWGHYTPRMATALWTPKLVCGNCLPALLVADPEDHCCHRCRTVAPELTVMVADLGWLLVALGLCDDCRDREVTP